MKRKAFNFFRSYYDVAKELNDKDRLLFYDCLIELQFNGKSKEIKGMAKFALLSQKHSIVSQIEGYNNFCKKSDNEYVQIDFDYTFIGASAGGEAGASAQVEGEEEEKVQYVDTSLENCIKLFLEKTAYNWTEQYAKKEAEKFYNFYSAKGWMVGKNKMKSVGHAVSGWIARNDKPEKVEKPIEQMTIEEIREMKNKQFRL